ncbi:speckle-type POZ protein B-like [Leptopilina heterotoma]|uniref:speckle-type POZ protein B-like n=1 Tax=Leptopilina heterotoma TaxID=63436 RepID=UPI001CA9EA45|nr:speckle-type POZ protein B-like [Leptopilina heterotoma]XP_043479765.1 speckle-type POZ protein B-like [Leptopilina heterotoma]
MSNYTSKIKFNHYELNWTIENFPLICSSVKIIESPKFPSKDLSKCQWFLEFKPTKLIESNTEEFFIFLKNTNKGKFLNAIISFYSQSEVKASLIHSISIDKDTSWSMSGSELSKIFGKNLSKVVLVKCNLSVIDSLSTVEEEPPFKRRKCNNDLMENMTSLLSDENFKDVRFKVGDKEFTAHKAILTIQSPVFAAMFNSKMSEELTSIVEIKDVKPEIFQQMLNFIYNVEVKDLDEVALELFCVAEKYQLEELKTNCINSLHKCLSAKTVFDTLEMADLYSLLELKSECLKLLIAEWIIISETMEFKKFIQNRPNYVIEIVNMRKKMDKEENAENNKSLSLPFVFVE